MLSKFRCSFEPERMKRMALLIYVVEDDRNICEIESYALKNNGYKVEIFPNAESFYEKMEQHKPDLILLDVMLPDEDGFHILQKLRSNRETRDIPVLMVTAKSTEIDKVRGLDMGADDYLTKPFGVMELISRVKALLRRSHRSVQQNELVLDGIYMNLDNHVVNVNGEVLELTYKEYELCRMLMQNIGNAIPREKFMTRIWGADYEGESRTLDMHIKTLRKKLGDQGSHIKTVRNVGYRMEE